MKSFPFLFIFILIFEFYISYDVFPITNFEKKFITFNSKDDFIIYRYYVQGPSNLTTYYHHITYYDLNAHDNYIGVYFYLYDDFSKIKQDEYNHFIDYNNKECFTYDNNYLDIEDTLSKSKNYYFVLQSYTVFQNITNLTFSVYTTDTIVNIDNIIQARMELYSRNIYNYKFNIPLEHKKYLLYDFDTGKEANITVVDNKEKIVYQKNSIYGQNYLELKDGCSYNIYLSLSELKKYSKGFIYFYFIQSKYTKYFPVIMNTKYFQNFICDSEIKLLLDLSTIKKGYIVWIEYSEKYGSSYYHTYSLVLYSYNTEDEDIIEKTEGKKLEFNKNKYCYGNICKGYIHKNSDDIKTVILELKMNYRIEYKDFDIRYGKTERYIPQTVLYSFIIGLSLTIPNLVFQIILCYRDEKLKCRYKGALFMDFILHIPHGCVLSVLFYLAGRTSLIVSYWFYGAYGVLLIIHIIGAVQQGPSMFAGAICLFTKVKKFRTFKEALNDRKNTPPRVIIDQDKYHFNPNEGNHFEYEYCSWEDNTIINLNKNNPVLKCKFKYDIILDDTAKEDLEDVKKTIATNEKSIKKSYSRNNEFYEHFIVPNFTNEETCFLEPTNRKDKFFLFVWVVAFITGYLDILEPFIYYEIGNVDVNITKLVSNTKRYQMDYKSKEIKTEICDIPDEEEFYKPKESSDNTDTKEVELMAN